MKKAAYICGLVMVTIIILYGLWLMVRVFLFDYFTIPSDSMTPTLEPGSKVIVNKMIMGPRIYTDFCFDKKGQELRAVRLKGLRPLRHNDIVVFNYPLHHDRISFVINHVYCKRIIGLPGDSISAVNGHLFNNNFDGVLGCAKKQKQLEGKDERTLRKYGVYRVAPRNNAFSWNIKDWGPLYVPRKDDEINITPYTAIMYRKVLEWETGNKITWNWETGKVYSGDNELSRHRFLHNYYHLCGDYALDSFDSRYWGFVPEEYIVGVVWLVVNKEYHIERNSNHKNDSKS